MGIGKDKSQSAAATELRLKAEEQLRAKTAELCPPRTIEETRRLVHELEVHRIELEMQNAELRQARDEAETAMEKYADLYDFAPVGYLTLDRKGAISAVNLTGSGLMGIERSLLIGRRFGLFLADEARPVFAGFLEKVFKSPAKETCKVALRKAGDSELFVHIEGVAAASGEECRIALIDITETKRAEEALVLEKEKTEALRLETEAAETLRLKKEAAAEALRMMTEAAEALRLQKEAAEAIASTKSLFFANMSHELRTPMTGILGMLQLAIEEDLAPAPREYLETTLRSARSLLRILNDILDMAKIEARKLAIEEKPFSLQRLVTEEAAIMIPEVRRKGLDFIISMAPEVPETVAGDEARLRQILLNLIGNAIKFTEAGKVEVRVSAGRTTCDGKREIAFAVTDTGIGIPDGKKELLFQAFSQVDPSHSRSFGGTGLGLAICREIVGLMGGAISFESEEGVGSTFSFVIPLREAGPENASPNASESVSPEKKTSAPEGGKTPHLLLAEDDPTIRQILKLMLTRSNYSLDIAEDGKQAVEKWEQGRYDLVLMDVQMPRMNGFEATAAIREKELERGGRTPIVAMTAHAGKEDEERCLAAGMDGFISKPVDFKECLQRINDTLKKRA